MHFNSQYVHNLISNKKFKLSLQNTNNNYSDHIKLYTVEPCLTDALAIGYFCVLFNHLLKYCNSLLASNAMKV